MQHNQCHRVRVRKSAFWLVWQPGHNGKIILSVFLQEDTQNMQKNVMACVENVIKACNYYNSQVRAFSYYYETTRKVFCAKINK